MPETTDDIISFNQDESDINWVLDQLNVSSHVEKVGGEVWQAGDGAGLLHAQARIFFDAVRDHPINRLEGEAAGIIGKYHYNLNKALLGLFEFSAVEAAALAVASVTPPLGVALAVFAPVVSVFTKWSDIVTHLEHDEVIVLSAMTDLIKSDYTILREQGVSEAEIEKELKRAGLSVPDLPDVLGRLCGDYGKKKVVIKSRGAGDVDRYTPI